MNYQSAALQVALNSTIYEASLSIPIHIRHLKVKQRKMDDFKTQQKILTSNKRTELVLSRASGVRPSLHEHGEGKW